MQTTDDIRLTTASKLADLRAVPLAELSRLGTVTFDEAQGRAAAAPAAVPAPAFSSAI
ncbi:MAG TPA: hypothetical protein VH637_08380 [Streptosporangiaceae bacterium]|jgi:hypothetical protein